MSAFYSQNFIGRAPVLDSELKLKLDQAQNLLRKQILDNKIAPLDVNNACDIEEIEVVANNLKSYKTIYVLGVGGSSLGAKTLAAIGNNKRIKFIESIDPKSINAILRDIDLDNSYFIVISKSGETIETLCQILALKKYLIDSGVKDFSQKFLFITQDQQSSLGKIAQELNCKILPHKNDIGGRYSCFSIVGLLPAMIAGLDIKKVRSGAKEVLDYFLQQDDIKNSCYNQLQFFSDGFTSNVVMPYIDDLKNFTDWYRQLWAESLGKNGFGATPINSMGTVDQHSQLQLYIDGPQDKFFTFIISKNHEQDLLIEDIKNCPTLFGGKNLSKILQIEQDTTIDFLRQKNLPIRIIEIDSLNEAVLGGLMMQMFLEVILIAFVKEIDPFDQPAVEKRKLAAKKILSTRSSAG